jgi:DNA gyrase/topoisomerase IV subunit B
MYIGTTDDAGITHCFREIFDNATDEVRESGGKSVYVELGQAKISPPYAFVMDTGRGIPVGASKDVKGSSTLTTIFTHLHAGGKTLQTGAYESARGTHGVGAAVVNALAQNLRVWSNRDKKWHLQDFKLGIPVSYKPFKSGPPSTFLSAKSKEFAATLKSAGAAIQFTPDPKIFKKSSFDLAAIRAVVKTASYFLPGVSFVLNLNGKVETFKTKGLVDLVPDLAKEAKTEIASDIFSYSKTGCAIALAWSESPDELCRSYVSGGLSEFGGTHQKALDKLVVECMLDVGGRNAKKVKPKFFKTGVISVVDVSINHPTFDSQTKSRLTSKAAELLVMEAKPALIKFLKENKQTVLNVVERALRMQDAEDKFKVSATAASKLKAPRGKIVLPIKLAVSSTRNPEERELFILEGDSAAGTAKAARNPHYQEVLPLRGKFTNPFKLKDDRVFANESVLSIFQSIGYNPSHKTDPLADMRVGRILFLSDADEDGHHINSLLAALFAKYMPELFASNKVFVVKAPLFRATYKDSEYYGSTLKEVHAEAGRKTGLNITRFKGWGESGPASLKKIAFNPETRKLMQLSPLDAARAEHIQRIMGEETTTRRELLGLENSE